MTHDEFHCKWCSGEIFPREKKVGRGYCSRRCQIGDLGHKGADEENKSLQAEHERNIRETIKPIGCLLVLVVIVLAVVYLAEKSA